MAKGQHRRTLAERRTTGHDPVRPCPPSWIARLGEVFGRLTVIGFTGVVTKHGQKKVTCRCVCGLYVHVMMAALTSGQTTSCGCSQSEDVAQRNVDMSTHGATRGPRRHYLYLVWDSIKTRCFNDRSQHYVDYGGRGITMDRDWQASFSKFRDDVLIEIGERPSRLHSIDRITNDGNYVPGNIRWATKRQQARNQRTTRYFEFDGKRATLHDWSDRAGIRGTVVYDRVVRYGWSPDEALGTPAGSDTRTRWTSTDGYRRVIARL
jgi:hypothetical protein